MKKVFTQSFFVAIIFLFSLKANGQIINTFAGTGVAGFSGDGGISTSAQFSGPNCVYVDLSVLPNTYIVDNANARIRKITSAGIVSTFAGTGTAGFSGDGGLATGAQFNNPYGVLSLPSGASSGVYIADRNNNRIRKINNSTGIISTFAGTGVAGFSGDGGLATNAKLNMPTGLAEDGSGNIYIADWQNNRIRKVAAVTGIISTFAGNGVAGYSGNGGPASSASLKAPMGVAVDINGNVYIADTGNNAIRVVNTSGIISTFAGTTIFGFSGDGSLATNAQLNIPTGIAVATTGAGIVYIADSGNRRIRNVNPSSGIINTYAGTGVNGFSGDGGPAVNAQISSAPAVAVDGFGVLYIADLGNNRVRSVTLATDIDQFAINNDDYLIYPNPINSFLSLKSKTTVEKIVKLNNTLGEEIYLNYFQDNLSIDLSNFSSGIYFLSIQSDKNLISKKIIISH